MKTERTIDSLKSLVYGRGRAAVIKIVPQNYNGKIGMQVESLGQDVVNAPKVPLDAEDATVQHLGVTLAKALECHEDFDAIADALTRYVQARVEWTARAAVE